MSQKELLKTVARWLDQAHISYMLTGAWSIIFYGRTRTSHDLDFVVEMSGKDIPNLEKSLRLAGNRFLWQSDAIEEAVEKKGMFNVIYLPSHDKIDFWILKNTQFDKHKFERRIKVAAWGRSIYVPTPEDTILQKLKWYNQGKIEKHLVDAAFVWKLQKKLDKIYILKWAKILEVEKYLPELEKINLEDHY